MTLSKKKLEKEKLKDSRNVPENNSYDNGRDNNEYAR